MKRLIVLLMLTGVALPALAKSDWKGKVMDEKGEPLVGYWVGKPFWNQGICTEALRLMIDHIHRTTDIKSLISSHLSLLPVPTGR